MRRIDGTTIAGLILGIGAFLQILLHGGILKFLLNAEAITLIFGGTIASVLMSFPWEAIKEVPTGFKMMLFPPQRPDSVKLIYDMKNLAIQAARDGIERIDVTQAASGHPFLIDTVHLLGDGMEYDALRERLERELLTTQYRHSQLANIFLAAGMYSPIFGLLGTLIGVVQVLKNITNPQEMGASMAIAMTASFYGIFSANFVFLPVANKLKYYSDEELLNKELIAKGALSIRRGDGPWLTARKLEAFLSYKLRNKKVIK